MVSDLNKSQMERLLRDECVGRLACIADGRPYVVPLCFVYNDGRIFAHSGLGLKVDAMRENPQVCFEVDTIGNLVDWQSVIAWGVFEELTGAAAENALRMLVEKLEPHLPGGEPPASNGPDGASTRHILDRSSRHGIVFQITIGEMTGRRERLTS